MEKLLQLICFSIACTKEPKSETIQILEDKKITIIDLPGIGEDQNADESYKSFYKYSLPNANLLVWVFQADTRVYKPDQIALVELSSHMNEKCEFIFCLNQVDNIGNGNWNNLENRPSDEQLTLIKEKKRDIFMKFQNYSKIKQDGIFFTSVLKNYGIETLYNQIIK